MRYATRVVLGTERSGFPMMLLPPGVAPSSVTRVSVDVADRPGILLRVLGVCQRRGARVLAMTYGPSVSTRASSWPSAPTSATCNCCTAVSPR